MYKKILVPLENSQTDRAILEHAGKLARFCQASLILVHVADGFVARNQEELNLIDSEEIMLDRQYLKECADEFLREGISASGRLLRGDPAEELLKLAQQENCDLIAMATHGHKFLGDLILGSVADALRHRTSIPVLMLRAK